MSIYYPIICTEKGTRHQGFFQKFTVYSARSLWYNASWERRSRMKKWYIGSVWLILALLLVQSETRVAYEEPISQIETTTPSTAFQEEKPQGQEEESVGGWETLPEPAVFWNGYYHWTAQEESYIQVANRRVPLHIRQLEINYSKGVTIQPIYIVIHETNNYNVGANANAHYRYWSTNPKAQASTHFVVDHEEIYQMLALDQAAWHVGDRPGYSDINNFNSIGIEIAVNADGDYFQARQNAIQLTINLMNYLGLDITRLKRHYDATGKWCPTIMLNEPALWDDFVYQVSLGL